MHDDQRCFILAAALRRLTCVLACAAALCASGLAVASEARFSAAVAGEGPDVVLLPGLASSGAVWDGTVERLAGAYRVHVVQIAGFAGAPPGDNIEGPVLAPLVDEIGDYLARLDGPAVIGHSLGGLIGLEIAARRPGAIDRLMVVDALPLYALVFDPRATPESVRPQAEFIRQQILAMDDAQFEAAQVASARTLVKDPSGQQAVLAWSLDSDRRVVATAMSEDLLTDARPRLPGIGIPVTVVYAYDPMMGRSAEAIDALYSSAYADLAGVRLRRIDDALHFLMLDRPDAFAAETFAFLERSVDRARREE